MFTTANELRLLAKAYMGRYESEESARNESSFHVYEQVDRLVKSFPERAFDFVVEVLRHNPSDYCFANLAAGPLEDLLVLHGERLIDRVEAEARRNQLFNELLGGVYLGRINFGVAQRVQEARNSVWKD